MVSKFAGAPLKNIAIGLNDDIPRLGECVITATGIEGSLIYALSAPIREAINRTVRRRCTSICCPGKPVDKLQTALSKPRGSRSMAKHLHSQVGIDGVKAALLRELLAGRDFRRCGAVGRSDQGVATDLGENPSVGRSDQQRRWRDIRVDG